MNIYREIKEFWKTLFWKPKMKPGIVLLDQEAVEERLAEKPHGVLYLDPGEVLTIEAMKSLREKWKNKYAGINAGRTLQKEDLIEMRESLSNKPEGPTLQQIKIQTLEKFLIANGKDPLGAPELLERIEKEASIRTKENGYETCDRCGNIGQDRRTLWMGCGYEMGELGIPFKKVKQLWPESLEEHTFFTLRVCKRCRSEWMTFIDWWFKSTPPSEEDDMTLSPRQMLDWFKREIEEHPDRFT